MDGFHLIHKICFDWFCTNHLPSDFLFSKFLHWFFQQRMGSLHQLHQNIEWRRYKIAFEICAPCHGRQLSVILDCLNPVTMEILMFLLSGYFRCMTKMLLGVADFSFKSFCSCLSIIFASFIAYVYWALILDQIIWSLAWNHFLWLRFYSLILFRISSYNGALPISLKRGLYDILLGMKLFRRLRRTSLNLVLVGLHFRFDLLLPCLEYLWNKCDASCNTSSRLSLRFRTGNDRLEQWNQLNVTLEKQDKTQWSLLPSGLYLTIFICKYLI